MVTFWTLAETYVEGDSADESRLEFLFWVGLLRSGSLGDLSPPFLSPSISRVLLWPLWRSSIWTISSFVKIGVLALFGVFGSFLSLTLTPVSFYCSDSPFGPLSKCNRLIQTYKIFESGFQVPLFSQLDNLFGTPSTVQTKQSINIRKSSPVGQTQICELRVRESSLSKNLK